MRPRCASLNLAPPLPKYIHTHGLSKKSMKCVLAVSGPLECRGCHCKFKGYFLPASVLSNTWMRMLSLFGYISISNAKTIKSSLLRASLNLESTLQWPFSENVTENTRTWCALSVFTSGRANFECTIGTCISVRLWDEQQSCLIPLSGQGSFGNAPPAHTVLHLASWRNRFRELAETQCKSSVLPIPPLQSHPWGLIWSCQANPPVARCQLHGRDRSLE